MGEPKKGMEGLLLLLQRVRLEAARSAASPAERLLDDVLRLLDPMRPIDSDQDYEVRPMRPMRCAYYKYARQLPAQPVSERRCSLAHCHDRAQFCCTGSSRG